MIPRKHRTIWPTVEARTWVRTSALVLLCSVMGGCADSARQTITPSGTPMPQIKVLTYNTWHGLEPSGRTVKSSESTAVRQARLDRQFRQLSVIQPDVMLLQEVNPLPEMAQRYVTAMKRYGLQYASVHQVDACGVRLAPGLAVVPGLNNGLAVLAKAPLLVRKVTGLKLSGGVGRCNDYMGFQTGSLRYALIAEIENPNTGRKLLTVSLHLHSGIERNAFFIQKINEYVDAGKVRREDFEEIVAALEKSQERRLEEIRRLLKEIQKLNTNDTYVGGHVGGDYNFETDDPQYR